jgi:hypothetical protein
MRFTVTFTYMNELFDGRLEHRFPFSVDYTLKLYTNITGFIGSLRLGIVGIGVKTLLNIYEVFN